MNKTAIKNFSIWARNKLIAEITYKAGLLGISAEGIKQALPQSDRMIEYYDIGTKKPYAISGIEMKQRRSLTSVISVKQAGGADYVSAFNQVIEEVAYTWFNRLIAIRFMEVNDYLPSRIRVLSSLSGKNEPDIVTTPFEAQLEYTEEEKAQLIKWKNEEKLDEAFRFLLLKQCNELNAALPDLFEKVSDYTELLLTVSFTDKDGVICHLVRDIPEEDFNVQVGGQVEIIGWLYQYYNTEPKAQVFARPSGTKIKKEELPAATQLFTPDWIVRYMVENSLGRLWVEGHPNDTLKAGWKYYLEEATQEPEVQEQLAEIRNEYAALVPEEIRCIDPCAGSGHILCAFFDVLMQIYESRGYTTRDAARSILENNIWGLDIDKRAAQLAYFSVMMKARQYDRRILTRGIRPHVYAIEERNGISREQLKLCGTGLNSVERNNALNQISGLLDQLEDAKEYGSLLTVDAYDWALLRKFVSTDAPEGQLNMNTIGLAETRELLLRLIDVGETLAQKYQVTVTNPPYMAVSNASPKVQEFIKKHYPDAKSDLFAVFIERCGEMTKRCGYQAMITQHAWMFLSSFEKLREKLQLVDTVNMAHLGARAFEEISGEVVQTTSFVLRKSHIEDYRGVYCRLTQPNTQQGKEELFLAGESRYIAKQSNFSKIPGSPVAYWTEGIIKDFQAGKRLAEVCETRKGLATSDNNHFLRRWYEVSFKRISFNTKGNMETTSNKIKWYPLNKGGEFRRWYGNREFVINWENDGFEIRNFKDEKGKLLSRPQNTKYNFKPAVTWSKIASSTFSARFCEGGFLFDDAAAICYHSDSKLLKYILGFLNTSCCQLALNILNPTLNVQIGDIGNLPIILDNRNIESVVDICINIARADWDSYETSWDFQRHPLIHGLPSVQASFEAWQRECDTRFQTLKANEEELNRIFIDIYGLQDELTPEVEDKDVTVRRIFDTKEDIPESMKGSSYALTKRDVIVSLISYAVGCMFGRYSLDVDGLAFAGGTWDDTKYQTFIPDKDGVIPITDEDYFDDDIVGLFCAWLKAAYGKDALEQNLDFIAKALGSKGGTSREIIRNYFLNDFFKDHMRTYQKRPIYWIYDSGRQNGFKALIYLHRYDADTSGRVRAGYLHRMERIYESEILRMTDMVENSRNNYEAASASKRREKLQRQLKECRDYDERLAHIALSRIEIDLDDGVRANYRKAQTDRSGQFYEILANSKDIMSKK